jgi:signal transduction histidine kinase
MNSQPPKSQLAEWIAQLRWLVPIALSLLGMAYTFGEGVWLSGHALFSFPILLGIGMLGILGPVITFITLTYALDAVVERAQAEQARERQRQQLIALNKIGEVVNQSLELDEVLNRAIDQVLQVMHLESGEVRLIENGQLVLHTARGVSPAFQADEFKIPIGQCLCGKSAQQGQVIAIEDLARVTNLERKACACERFQSVLSVPVRTNEHVVGTIHVGSHVPRKFDDAERTLLSAIGYQVGVAIEKARLHAQLKTLNQQLESRVIERTGELLKAKEALSNQADELRLLLVEELRIEERTRAQIAHDLHDSVQQLIVGALFETQAARDALAKNPTSTASSLTATQELLRRIESEMRSAIHSLRPTALDAHGLVPALREYVTGFSHHTGIECNLSFEGPVRRFNPDGEVAVFRIVQEALNNVQVHARATHVQIHMVWGVLELRVEILDNGNGFDLAEVSQQTRTHLGLIGMQERAQGVGGTLHVAAQIGEGTRVSLRVPVN